MQQFDGGSSSSSNNIMDTVPKKKQPRKAGYMSKIMGGDDNTKSTSFNKRYPTLKTKASQLQTLCDVSVCVVSTDANGEVSILWPADRDQAREAIEAYRRVDKRQRHELTVLGYMQEKKRKLEKKMRDAKTEKLAQQLSRWIDSLSPLEDEDGDALAKVAALLESKIVELEGKGLTKKKKSSTGDDDEEGETSSEEEIRRQSSSLDQVSDQSSASVDYNSLEDETRRQQGFGLGWNNNNGGLADHPVESYYNPLLVGGRGDGVSEVSLPVWKSVMRSNALAKTKSGGGGEDETNQEGIGRQRSSFAKQVHEAAAAASHDSLEGGTRDQPFALAWNNNGGLADLVQSCNPRLFGSSSNAERSLPVWETVRSNIVDHNHGGKSMMVDESPPLFGSSSQGATQFGSYNGRGFGSYPGHGSLLHEALPLSVWHPQYPLFGGPP